MLRLNRNKLVLILATLSLMSGLPVSAQINPPGTTALEDVSAGAVGERAPGRLVQEGVARHEEFQDFDFEITEQPVPSPRAVVLQQVFETLFEELNAAIDAFTALLIARAGGNPISSFTGFLGNS